ncbi:Vegetative incompatibility HET-E-1 [Fusarium agapanthi]|uniref:Vegetative incompatibility HET-E-1 n=1 Tax=Fusarium agapanthi TaxID=1803897 RepID=A0A9P5B1A1_9HYPO|nr:Vegetative incompatibility HET-E-1 [Fusarium agapanthi]
MASNQRTSFERSLDLFRRELSDDQIKQISGDNQKTVTDTIQEIQEKLGRRNDLCRLTRVQGFLHAMEQIEKLVTVFLNTSDFVAFIWGPIKLALMVTTSWTDAIMQLIDAYEEISEALSNLAFFHNLIQSRDYLKLVLEDYFSDILRFHRCVLDVFSRPGRMEKSLQMGLGSFRREVKPILESLKRKQALLSDDKLQSHAILKEVQDSEQYAKDQFNSLHASLEDVRSALASEQLQSKTLQAREMNTYLENRLDISKSQTDLQLQSGDFLDDDSGNWIFSDPIFKCWEGGKSAENRVLFLNGSLGSDQLLPAALCRGCHLKILVCGQRDGVLDDMLSSLPQIRLDLVDAHQKDIEQVTKVQAAKKGARFQLARQEEEKLACKVASASRGMFLYARVVLDNLAAMDSKRDYKDELESEGFPKDLDHAYLIRNRTINLLEEHIDMALFCCRYLSSRPFTTCKSQDITGDIHSGYFGFLDYATAHYAVHIREVEASGVSTASAPKSEAVKLAAVNLAEANHRESSVQSEDGDEAFQDLNLAIQDNVLAVRTLIGLQRGKAETSGFDAIEGPLRHKCHKTQCFKFATGCSSEAALKQHLAVHERPWRCPHTDCFAHSVGYPSLRGLEDHNEAFHYTTFKAKAVFPADLETCERDIREACKDGNLEEVKRFHRGGGDLNGTRLETIPPLCAAVEAGHGLVCKYFVDNGINPFMTGPGSKSMDSRTPIAVAIYWERLDILEFFLRRGKGPSIDVLAKNIARAIHANRPAALNVLLNLKEPKDHADMITQVMHHMVLLADWRSSSTRADSHSSDATLIHAWFQYVKPEFYNMMGVFIAKSDNTEYRILGDIFFRDQIALHKALYGRCHYLATFLMDISYYAKEIAVAAYPCFNVFFKSTVANWPMLQTAMANYRHI